jgi:hypothetical protein
MQPLIVAVIVYVKKKKNKQTLKQIFNNKQLLIVIDFLVENQ